MGGVPCDAGALLRGRGRRWWHPDRVPLTLWVNPVLDLLCRPVAGAELGSDLADLCALMLRVMCAAQGAGLTACQVGELSRFLWTC